MSKKSSEEGGYWPGFVDALTNVVFVMIILVIVLMLMFMMTVTKIVQVERERVLVQTEAEKSQAVAEALAVVAQQQAALSATETPVTITNPAPTQLPTVPNKPNTNRNVTTVTVSPNNTIRDQGSDVASTQALAFVAFPARETGFEEKAQADLKRVLSANMDRIRRDGLTMRSDAVPPFVSEGRRLAYYRVVVLREWLVAQGVASEKIDMRITDVPNVEGKQGVLLMHVAAPTRGEQ